MTNTTFDQWLDEPSPTNPKYKRRDCFSARVCADFRIGWEAATAQPAAVEPHSDDLAVDRFAAAMKAKLAKQRAKGYGGWKTCPVERLQEMLFAHVTKGDPVDVANFAMMLSSRDASTARAAPSQAAAVPEAVERDAARADPWAILHRQLCMKPDRCSECDRIAALSQGDVSGEGEGS